MDASGAIRSITLSTEPQHDTAVALFKEGKDLIELVNQHYAPIEEQIKALTERKKQLKDGDLAKVQPLQAHINTAIIGYRKQEAEKVAERARVDVEAANAKIAAERAKAEAALQKEVKGLKGDEKRDAQRELEELQQAPLPSVESAVERARRLALTQHTGAGAAPMRTYWSAGILDVGKIAAHVVASSEELYALATELRKQRKAGDGFQMCEPEALVGIAKVKGEIKSSPYLNDKARALEAKLRISGVEAVSREGLRNV